MVAPRVARPGSERRQPRCRDTRGQARATTTYDPGHADRAPRRAERVEHAHRGPVPREARHMHHVRLVGNPCRRPPAARASGPGRTRQRARGTLHQARPRLRPGSRLRRPRRKPHHRGRQSSCRSDHYAPPKSGCSAPRSLVRAGSAGRPPGRCRRDPGRRLDVPALRSDDRGRSTGREPGPAP